MPNWAHVHVMLNHIPIVGVPLAALLLGLGHVRRSGEMIRTASAILVLLGVATIGVKLTGEPAEEAVEQAAWFNEGAVETHEELANVATIVVVAASLVAAAAWWRGRRAPPGRALVLVQLLLAGLASGILAAAALRGGAIRHDEFGLSGSSQPEDREDRR